jgi:dimethylhistidine N-methyltransferase
MNQQLTFHDYKPGTLSLFDAVVNGLSQENKSIAPKFFYDQRGSKLFDLICNQPEYYPPTVEQDLLLNLAGELVVLTGQDRLLIEPGAGSAAKVRLLLKTLKPSAYVPMDISFIHLKIAVAELVSEFPWLPVHATCVDFTHSLPVPDIVPEGPRLLFFPGSSIGNFEPSQAGQFLGMVHEAVGKDGMLLIGVDTKKDKAVLNAAYNDEAGVTAEFNLNLLHRLRTELGIKCDPMNFEHRAFYNPDAGRVEMYLVSNQRQTLRLNGHSFDLEPGETVHTENSYKYTPTEFLELASENGFSEVRHWLDDNGLFCIYLFIAR